MLMCKIAFRLYYETRATLLRSICLYRVSGLRYLLSSATVSQPVGAHVKTYSYYEIFHGLDQKEYSYLGSSVKVSFSTLYLQIEHLRYLFKDFYNLDNYTAQYFKIFLMFSLILLISCLLFGVAYFFSLNSVRNAEKLSQYECGFEPFDEATRHPFDIHFYIVGILFLIFDVEIVLLFPWIYSLKVTGW
ncbi:MAG: NADH-quinone oxidoreductase subunit A [Rhabdochlamydiaceae bacterium]